MNTTKGFLTVGQLKEIIANCHDDVQLVVTDDATGNYLNIDAVRMPDDESYFAITLYTADTFDARQF